MDSAEVVSRLLTVKADLQQIQELVPFTRLLYLLHNVWFTYQYEELRKIHLFWSFQHCNISLIENDHHGEHRWLPIFRISWKIFPLLWCLLVCGARERKAAVPCFCCVSPAESWHNLWRLMLNWQDDPTYGRSSAPWATHTNTQQSLHFRHVARVRIKRNHPRSKWTSGAFQFCQMELETHYYTVDCKWEIPAKHHFLET